MSLGDTFEAFCQIANAKRKLRESGGLMQAAWLRKQGAQIHIKRCKACGDTTNHDVWCAEVDGVSREHNRCWICGTVTTY